MPRRDGTGPAGAGALTGKGMGYCGIPRGIEARVGRGRRFSGMGYGRGYGTFGGRGLGLRQKRGLGLGCDASFAYGRQWRRRAACYFPTYGPADEETALQEESTYLETQAALIRERLEQLSRALEKAQDAKKRTGNEKST